MDMRAYYKTDTGKIFELEDLTYQDLTYINITELVLNENCESVWCQNNQLTELVLNDNCEKVRCWNNKLKELDTNKSEYVSCDMKSLTNLNKVKELRLWI